MRHSGFAFVLLFFALAAACSRPQPTVNRVQANAVEKAVFLNSDWYALRTVIDTPYTSSASFVGESGFLQKVRWEIQEKYLIARRTYQYIRNSESQAIAGKGANQDAAVAMYAIESHFDIRRDYNTVTGEEMNVVVENDSDRVWYQREYMRVDWSKNLISSEDLSFTGSLGGIKFEPVDYYIQDPQDPLAPKFIKDENGQVYYIDIVNKYFVEPDSVEVEDIGKVPACYLVFSSYLDCQPGEIAVRNSFLRVDPKHDYQPFEYTSDRMNDFGYFLTVRDGYDPHRGVTINERMRFANRHNVWRQSHRLDKEGNLVACTKADENKKCGGGGSTCDMDLAKARNTREGACTIPYREREIKPIVYHLSRDFPEDLVPDAEAMADSWNRAFTETVDSLRRLECKENGGGDTTCEKQRGREDAKRVFVLCHSPVRGDDHEACGPEGTVAEIGDLRYSLVAWVPEPHESSPLGYGPSFADPETGEIIAAAAYIYGAEVERYTAKARDMLALINNDLEEKTLTSNALYGDWMRRFSSGYPSQAFESEADYHVVKVDGRDAARINGAMDFSWMRELLGADKTKPSAPTVDMLITRYQDARDKLINAVGELDMGDKALARLEQLKGTAIEQLMVDDELRYAAGLGLDAPLSDEAIEAASPLRGMSTERFRALADLRRRVANERNGCLLRGDFVDDGLLGLVRAIDRAVKQGDGSLKWYGVKYQLKNEKGGVDYGLVQKMLRHPVFNSSMIHEVGHTLGLRHNFSGSYDSLNYHKRYWQLRDDGNMLPRAWDPMTQAEIDGRIREYEYSSVMDYGNNAVVTSAAGIGHYDKAAIKMGYGDLAEVFTRVPGRNQRTLALITAFRGFGWPGALDMNALNVTGLRMIPYTEIPQLVGGVEAIESREDVRFADLVDGTGSWNMGVPTSDPGGRPVVPYYYCGDEFADFQPSCLRYDAGADEYETLMSIMDLYWNYYLFNNFMRQGLEFSPDNEPQYVYDRYFSKLQGANVYYTLFRGILASLGADEDFYQKVDGFGAYTIGIGASYQLLSKVIATPEPGVYAKATDLEGNDVYAWVGSGTAPDDGSSVTIDSFDGRALYTTYDLGPDQSFWYLTRAGYFLDKALAMQVLGGTEIQALGEDTNADLRRFQVSFYTTFQQPLTALFRGVIGNDWSVFAPRWSNDALAYPDAEAQLNRDLSGIIVDPNVGFSLQLNAMVYGMALFPQNFDQSFVDKARLYVRGGAEGVDPELANGAKMIEFTDSNSGLVYMAPSFPDEEGRETGVAARMLQYAQLLKDKGSSILLNEWIDNLDIMRRLTWLFGFGGSFEVK